MKELLEKLSSYNIFNCLLPGIVFVVIADNFTSFHFIQEDILIGLFFYYFIGMIISRIGSLLIEPFLKKIGFIHFSTYNDFVNPRNDEKLEVFSETNNMYRTLCSLFTVLIFIKTYEWISCIFPVIKHWIVDFSLFGLLILFLFSYRKQTKYITDRIKINNRRD